jgi:hypothetical protein
MLQELDPLKLQALDFESMANAYSPFVRGEKPIDNSYWSY